MKLWSFESHLSNHNLSGCIIYNSLWYRIVGQKMGLYIESSKACFSALFYCNQKRLLKTRLDVSPYNSWLWHPTYYYACVKLETCFLFSFHREFFVSLSCHNSLNNGFQSSFDSSVRREKSRRKVATKLTLGLCRP